MIWELKNKISYIKLDIGVNSNNLMLIDMIGIVIGKIIGNNKRGKINDFFLAYIVSAETIVPQIDKSIVGKIIPKSM